MELENFKNTWEQLDTKLTENLKLNEQLLKNLNFGNTKNEMQKLLVAEQVNIIGIFLSFAFFGAYSLRLIDDLQYSIPGFIGSFLLLVYLSFAIIKVKALLKVDYYNTSIVSLQKELSKVKVLILRLRRIESLLMPVLMLSLLPVTFIVFAEIDIYQHLGQAWLQILLFTGFVITLILVIAVNKYFYDRKMQNAAAFLKELAQFEVSE